MIELSSQLTKAERDYLRKMFEDSAATATLGDHIDVELPDHGRDALFRTLERGRAELVVEDGTYRLSYRVELLTDPGSGLQRLRLSRPIVSDRTEHRLSADKSA